MRELRTALIIEAIDGITAPLRRMNRSIDRFLSPIRKVNAAVGRLGREVGLARLASATRDVGAGLSRASSEVGRLGIRIGALAGVGAYLFKTQLVDSAAQFEKFRAVLETVEGSSEKAQRSLDWVSDFATRTPYELDQVMEAFVQLRAYGLDPTTGLLATLGDAASAMGKPVMQAVEAIADAVTGQYERLKEFGIKAETRGSKTRLAFTDREGKQQYRIVDKNNRAAIESNLRAIWNEKYAGAMERQSKTFAGMVSNLSDAWTRFRVMIMHAGVFDWLKTRLGRLLDTVNAMGASGELQRLAERIGGGIAGAFEWVWSRRDDIVGAVKDIAGALRWMVGAVGGLRNAVILLGLAMSANAIGSILGLVVPVARLGWAALRTTGALGKLALLGAKLPALLALATNPVTLAIAAVVALGTAIYLVARNWQRIRGYFAGVWERFSRASTIAKIAVLAIATALVAPIAPIAALVAAGAALVRNWEPIKAFFLNLFEAIAEGVRKVVDSDAFQMLTAPLRWLGRGVGRLWGVAGSAVAGVGRGIAGIARETAGVFAPASSVPTVRPTVKTLAAQRQKAVPVTGAIDIRVSADGKARVTRVESSSGVELRAHTGLAMVTR